MAAIAILIGLGTGVISGFAGLGGGIFIVPALVYIFKMTQHQAQGTSLGMLLMPIGILGFLQYYRQGYVDFRMSLLLAAGFFVGAYAGGRFAQMVSDAVLRRLFAGILVVIAIKMWTDA